ncbi:MAG: hypothetical protein JXA21_03890 [Anaerolineae bacterium]|nr:hypothetical protein [Anaerolineae bacterium]
MRWYHHLTSSQRRILSGLAAGVILVLGLLGWSVWRTLRVSPLSSPPVTPVTPQVSTATVTPSPTPTPTETPTPVPTFSVADAGNIADRVAEARNVLPRWGTPLTLVTEHEMTTMLYQHYQTYPPLVLQLQMPLKALRLWFWEEAQTDPRAQAQNTAAIYLPQSEELYLQRAWDGANEVLDAQLAYGYARAIPDQYGDLPRLLAEAATLDRKLALSAVADGDALVALYLYSGVEPGSEEAQTLAETVKRASLPYWKSKDLLLTDLSQLTLMMGNDFATYQYAHGGTAALDEAILRPPRSTEQILHPERYASNEPPAALTPVDVDLGKDWDLYYEDTLGEALLRLVILEWSEGKLPADSVTEWGGDLLQIWLGPDEQDVVALHLAWDSNRMAGLFYGKMLELLPGPLAIGRETQEPPTQALPNGRWWAGTQGAAFLRRGGDRVYIVWGSDSVAVEKVSIALGAIGNNTP